MGIRSRAAFLEIDCLGSKREALIQLVATAKAVCLSGFSRAEQSAILASLLKDLPSYEHLSRG